MKATNATSLSTVIARIPGTPRLMPSTPSTQPASGSAACPPSPLATVASAGIRTSASTIARSSTISQPTAIRPFSLSMRWRSCSALSSTTVEATESARPNSSPPPSVQPISVASPSPRPVAPAICTSAPGIATARTDSRSLREKWSPTPNIRRMTPISESSCARLWSATKPGRIGTNQHARDEVADERRAV